MSHYAVARAGMSSSAAAYITGEIVEVNGGLLMILDCAAWAYTLSMGAGSAFLADP